MSSIENEVGLHLADLLRVAAERRSAGDITTSARIIRIVVSLRTAFGACLKAVRS